MLLEHYQQHNVAIIPLHHDASDDLTIVIPHRIAIVLFKTPTASYMAYCNSNIDLGYGSAGSLPQILVTQFPKGFNSEEFLTETYNQGSINSDDLFHLASKNTFIHEYTYYGQRTGNCTFESALLAVQATYVFSIFQELQNQLPVSSSHATHIDDIKRVFERVFPFSQTFTQNCLAFLAQKEWVNFQNERSSLFKNDAVPPAVLAALQQDMKASILASPRYSMFCANCPEEPSIELPFTTRIGPSPMRWAQEMYTPRVLPDLQSQTSSSDAQLMPSEEKEATGPLPKKVADLPSTGSLAQHSFLNGGVSQEGNGSFEIYLPQTRPQARAAPKKDTCVTM